MFLTYKMPTKWDLLRIRIYAYVWRLFDRLVDELGLILFIASGIFKFIFHYTS